MYRGVYAIYKCTRPQRSSDSWPGVIGYCDSPNIGPGKWTQVRHKSSTCSLPPSHFSGLWHSLNSDKDQLNPFLYDLCLWSLAHKYFVWMPVLPQRLKRGYSLQKFSGRFSSLQPQTIPIKWPGSQSLFCHRGGRSSVQPADPRWQWHVCSVYSLVKNSFFVWSPEVTFLCTEVAL